MLKKHKLIFSLLVVSSVIVVSLPLHAVDNYPYFDPKKDGYNIKDDESPWFDGKKKIKTVGDLKNIVNSALRSSDKTILIAIYNNQGQRRYIGVKLD